MHGFTSATSVNDVAIDDDGRPLTVLYIGDYDPSGPVHVGARPAEAARRIRRRPRLAFRIALQTGQTSDLPSFPASDKRKDPRYSWFAEHYGTRCWEIDAMDPRDLVWSRRDDLLFRFIAAPARHVFQFDKIVRSDSNSAALTVSQRAQATGSISALIHSSVVSRTRAMFAFATT